MLGTWTQGLDPRGDGRQRTGRWRPWGRGRARSASLARAAISLAAMTVVAALATVGPAGHASARDFRAADTQSETYPTVQALLYMDRLVRERTGGRHRILVFPSHQLGEEKETIEQTRAGAIDLNRVSIAPLVSFAPEARVLALPFLFASINHLHTVLDGPIGTEILDALSRHGFVGLTYYDAGSRSIYNSRRPIRTLADLAGLRIRVQQSDLMVAMVQALGAVPVELPYGQVSTGLSTGLVEGAENNWPSYVTTGHYALARYLTLTEHTMTPDVLLMSRKAWETLTPEDQAIFRQAARESSAAMRREWLRWEEDARLKARDAGVDIVTAFDRAAFVAGTAAIVDRAATDPAMRDLVARIRAARPDGP